jgi:acyl-coenzyme A synthetase/AMP-(fatty) acid ligase
VRHSHDGGERDRLLAHQHLLDDQGLGEEVKAYVILSDGATLGPDELVAWAHEETAAYEYPRLVEVVDSLPMTATGKIL